MRVTAVVPVKVLSKAKSRLSPVLGPEHRRELVLEMLEHVLGVVGASPVHRALVITRDPKVVSVASTADADFVTDPAATLNASLAEVFRACWAEGETPLYLPADLPRLEPGDVRAILATADEGQAIVVAPSRNEEGTNALLVPAALSMKPLLGVRSFPRHLARAKRIGIRAAVYRSLGLGLDIDTPEDLALVNGRAMKSSEVPVR
jgi:2-phospho-L-lactate guanylyltransferase